MKTIYMHDSYKFLAVLIIGFLLSACGGVHNTVSRQPDAVGVIKTVTILPIEATSKEQNADALALNAEWQAMAETELKTLLNNRKISVTSDAQTSISCRINTVYGSRALRYWVGFGAGKGSLEITIELKDSSGVVKYATVTKADLAIGAFGGSMSKVARKAIQGAVAEFGSRL